jgi:hypothetical protein
MRTPDVWETTLGFVLDWGHNELLPRMNALMSTPDDEITEDDFVPGDHCQFCPVLLDCPKMQRAFEEYADASEDFITMLTNQELDHYYSQLEYARRFMKALERRREGAQADGRRYPEREARRAENRSRVWKPGRPRRFAGRVRRQGFQGKKVKSPAQIEKLSSRGKELALEYGYKPDAAGLTIAPLSDPRPEAKPRRMQRFSKATPRAPRIKDFDMRNADDAVKAWNSPVRRWNCDDPSDGLGAAWPVGRSPPSCGPEFAKKRTRDRLFDLRVRCEILSRMCRIPEFPAVPGPRASREISTGTKGSSHGREHRFTLVKPARLLFSSITAKSAPRASGTATPKFSGTFGIEKEDFDAIVQIMVDGIKAELGSFSGNPGEYYLACMSGVTAGKRGSRRRNSTGRESPPTRLSRSRRRRRSGRSCISPTPASSRRRRNMTCRSPGSKAARSSIFPTKSTRGRRPARIFSIRRLRRAGRRLQGVPAQDARREGWRHRLSPECAFHPQGRAHRGAGGRAITKCSAPMPDIRLSVDPTNGA